MGPGGLSRGIGGRYPRGLLVGEHAQVVERVMFPGPVVSYPHKPPLVVRLLGLSIHGQDGSGPFRDRDGRAIGSVAQRERLIHRADCSSQGESIDPLFC